MIIKSPVASGIPFDPELSGMISSDANSAIIEAYQNAAGTSKGYIFAYFNGNANVGRWFEFFPGIDSNEAPLYTDSTIEIVEIVAATTAISATCTIGFYNLTTLLYTLTFTAEKRRIVSASPIFTLPATGDLKIKVDSGSISKPHLYFVARGA